MEKIRPFPLSDEEKPSVYPAPSITSPVIPEMVNLLDVEPAADNAMSFWSTMVLPEPPRAVDSSSCVLTRKVDDVGAKDNVGSGEGCSEGNAVGGSVGCSVGNAVGCSVGCSVGNAVGCSVGRAVGSKVGASVGAAVGASVGSKVGVNVGASDGTGDGAKH